MIILRFGLDQAEDFQEMLQSLPEKIKSRGTANYFETMMTGMEQIMADRLSGFQGKQRPWAEVYDLYLAGKYKIGQTPLIRSGELYASLTQSAAQFAIRRISNNMAQFGTSRLAQNESGSTYDLSRILSHGSSPKTTRIRNSKGWFRLEWENPAGKLNSAWGTSDTGANIAARPFLFEDKPMTPAENARLRLIATNYWRNFFAVL